MQDATESSNLVIVARLAEVDRNALSALDSLNGLSKTANVGNAGRLGAPGRDVARSSVESHGVSSRRLRIPGLDILQKLLDVLNALGRGTVGGVDVVDPLALDGGSIAGADELADVGPQLVQVGSSEARATSKNLVRHDFVWQLSHHRWEASC